MSDPENSGRISVSRADLRAELGALELRIVDRLSTAMSLKAETIVVDGLIRTMSEFSKRQDGIEQETRKRLDAIESAGKERRFLGERAISFLGLVLAVAALYFTRH